MWQASPCTARHGSLAAATRRRPQRVVGAFAAAVACRTQWRRWHRQRSANGSSRSSSRAATNGTRHRHKPSAVSSLGIGHTCLSGVYPVTHNIKNSVASLGLVSPGAATDGVTPFFLKKTDDLVFNPCPLESDNLLAIFSLSSATKKLFFIRVSPPAWCHPGRSAPPQWRHCKNYWKLREILQIL